MEMLNIPPAQPQASPAELPQNGTGKETKGFFQKALDNAGTRQAKGPQKKTCDVEEQATEINAVVQNSAQSGAAAEAELLLATLPADSKAEELVEEQGTVVDSKELSETALPVLAGELLAVTTPSGHRDGTNGVGNSSLPLAGKPGQNAQETIPATLAEATVNEGEKANTILSNMPDVDGAAEPAKQPLATSKAGPTTPGMAPAVGLRAGNPTAASHRQSIPQPLASTNVLQTGILQGEEQKSLEAIDGRKQPGLMESSLGSLLQEVRPMREQLRGQAIPENNRNSVLSPAAPAGEPRQVAVLAQNEDALSSFSFEQKTEAMLNGPGEEAAGTAATTDGKLFDTVLNNGLNSTQTIREGAHPLAANTTEAGSIRLSSGELLSENQVVDQVLQRIHLERGNEQNRIVIKMHPEELGEVKLALTMEKDQLRAQLLTQNQQVQEVLEKHLPRLHEALNQQGVHLEDIQVSVDSNRHSGREFFDRQQQPNSFDRRFNATTANIVDEQALAASNVAAQRDLAAGLSLRV